MKKIWTEYMDQFDAFYLTISFPISVESYKTQIIDFETFFLKKGFQWGIYKFESLKNGGIYPISIILNDYLSNVTDIISRIDGSSISLLNFTHWDFYKEECIERKDVIPVISIPLKNDAVWSNKNFSLSDVYREGLRRNFPLWSKYSPAYDLNYLEKSKEEKIEFNIYSNSNIWFEEFDMTFLEDDLYSHKYTFFDTPVNNRPTAYRITPRFNSFWRDIKSKVIMMGGEISIDFSCQGYTSGLTNEEGYILLDGQVVFQEDIDSGNIKIPD